MAGRAGAAVVTEGGSLNQVWKRRPRAASAHVEAAARGTGRPCAVGVGWPAGSPAGHPDHWQPPKPEHGPEPPSMEP